MIKVLGVSASLRNARFGTGSARLIEEIRTIKTTEGLKTYLNEQTKLRAKDFFEAGRNEGLSFDAIYRNLRKTKTDQGLSNSEAALVAGLWGAHQQGAEISHVGLASFFPFNGPAVDLDNLRQIILDSEGILISGPVYFGDRGSLSQSFFDFLRDDPTVSKHIDGKVYGGITVGAKRNGGQETTLIYQLIDAINLNMLAVGNDTETTSQYGGTVIAGDVGTMSEDEYGLKTSIGTGRRISQVSNMLSKQSDKVMQNKTQISVWLLQDKHNHAGRDYIENLCHEVEAKNPNVQFNLMDFTEEEIVRCIACDICPTEVGVPADYRCIIKSENDLFARKHAELLECDAIIVAAYSPDNREKLRSTYQRFIERTRYLSRDDYVLGNRLVAPLVISELNARQNLHIRMLTSFIRHNSIISHPLIGVEMDSEIINWDHLLKQTLRFARVAEKATRGRLLMSSEKYSEPHYNPVGYLISAEKRLADIDLGKVEESHNVRRKSVLEETGQRLNVDTVK